MRIELKTKWTQGIGLAVAIAVASLATYESISFFQVRQTREVFSAKFRADAKRRRMGEGLAATEAYIAALKAIVSSSLKFL